MITGGADPVPTQYRPSNPSRSLAVLTKPLHFFTSALAMYQ